MRKLIIDTDCGSDDAVALMMALKTDDVCIEAITTVCGNVPLDLATRNALMTIEISSDKRPPVYRGAAKPLYRDLVTAVNVHGEDGMSDQDAIHPTIVAEKEYAVDAILRLVNSYPYEIEIVAIGPVTNIALAIARDPSIMAKVKHIYSMGTAGFGRGNTTPVAEFNVYVDAEAYGIMLTSNIPITIVGFDICLGSGALNRKDIELLATSDRPEARFAVMCNKSLLAYNIKQSGEYMIDLPDAVAMGVVLWDDIVSKSQRCYCYTCTIEAPAYGQVIIDDGLILAVSQGFVKHSPNALVCRTLNNELYKEKLLDLLTK